MLILTRKPGESLYIGDVKVTIVEVKGNQIRIGIDAPPEIRIYREEIYVQILEENRKAAEAARVPGDGFEGLPTHWKGKEGVQGQGLGNTFKKPAVTGLRAFSSSSAKAAPPVKTPGETGGGNGGGDDDNDPTRPPRSNGDKSQGGDPEVIIRKKRKKFDE